MRNWKGVRATSLKHAMQLCKEFARDQRNVSVERIAEQMGLADHWILYKWISEGRMPAVMIPRYEDVCGCQFITRWLANTSDHLLIDMPTGRQCKTADMHALQEMLHTTTGALMQFYAGSSSTEDVLNAVKNAMETLGWHHHNVTTYKQPQLEL